MSLVVVAGFLRIVDLATIALVALLAYLIYLSDSEYAAGWNYYCVAALLAMFAAGTVFHWNGIYDLQDLASGNLRLGKLATAWGIVVLGLILVAFALKVSASYSRVWVGVWFGFSLVGMAAARISLWLASRRWVAQGRLTQNIAVVGGGEHGVRLINALKEYGDEGIRVIGVFDDRDRVPKVVAGVPRLGNTNDLLTYARQHRVDQVIVALPWSAEQRVLALLRKLRALPVDVRLAPDLVGFRLAHSSFVHIGGVPLLTAIQRPLADWHYVIKEIEDRALALLLLLLLAPLFLVVALAIKVDSSGPVFFRQRRYGFNNQLIHVFKFRTMYHHLQDERADRLATRDDPRVTRVGRLLRKSSIDELPQLINVLKGEMSIVGPRPHPVTAKAANRLYEEVVSEYAARHRVKPGITGWAQVRGWRGETDTEEKIQKRVEHDLYYIENWSLAFDLKILVLTVTALLKAENAY